jgi:hypothetical protein
MKIIVILLSVLSLHFFDNTQLDGRDNISDQHTDTIEVSMALHCDTNSYFKNFYSHPYPCQPGYIVADCQYYRNAFLDTCFNLSDSDKLYLSNKLPEKEFNLYSKYYKKYVVDYSPSMKKKHFKGFRFCVYKCKLVVKKHHFSKRQFYVPDNSKQLMDVKDVVYIDSVKLVRE